MGDLMQTYDPALVSLLVPGMVVRDDHSPHPDPAGGLRRDHPARRQLRRGPLRPARPAVLRRHLHRRGPLRRLRRHLRRRRGDLPRRPRRPGRASSSSPTTASTSCSRSRRTTTRSPPDTLAVVGNRSAVGEQYVELQPQDDERALPRPTTREIPNENTRTPIATQTLLTDLSNTVESVDKQALETTVTEMGKAFDGTGEDLGRIIDSGNAFIEAANDNFDVTTALIRDSNTVLKDPARQGQRDPRASRATSRCSAAPCAGSDRDLRKVIDYRLRDRHRAAHVPRGEPGRAGRADQQPGDHRRGRGQAPRRHPSRSW